MFDTRNIKSLPIGSRSGSRLLLSLLAMALLSLPAAAQKVNVTNLTSDIPAAAQHQDAHLVNPWGMSINPVGPWWISDNGTGLSTLYNGSGLPQSLVVTIPGAGGGQGTPTGTVFNGTSDFKIGGTPQSFIFCEEDGTVAGWASGTSASIAVDNSGSGAVYKGMAINSANGANYLYLANFHNGTVDVLDGTYAAHSFGSNAFKDSTIPTGFAPFNVQSVGTKIVVTYAKQDANKHDDVPGTGNGYVDIYDTQGNLLTQLQHVLFLNSPWGVALAPSSFSGFGNDLLIGNFGNGVIAAYNMTTGTWIGNMFDIYSITLKIDGLWGLGFGNGQQGGPTSTLFFTAGPFGEAHGIFGSITPHPGP